MEFDLNGAARALLADLDKTTATTDLLAVIERHLNAVWTRGLIDGAVTNLLPVEKVAQFGHGIAPGRVVQIQAGYDGATGVRVEPMFPDDRALAKLHGG